MQSLAAVQPSQAAAPRACLEGEYLAFNLGDEAYGVEILKVQEIRGYERPTRIANAPAYIKGVVNLRGIIVPIIDMRIKFGLPTVTYDAVTVVIILNLVGRVVGMVVDGVSDVLTLTADEIRPPPQLRAGSATEYVTGLGALDQRMLILVDIEKLMGDAGDALVAASLS